jgi:hypothetical protein
MYRKILLLTTTLVLLLALSVASAGATTPSGVHIEVETSILGDPSPFVASGPAVAEGLICDTGIVVEDSSKVTGFSDNGFNWKGVKHFTCDDGSGEFFVNLQARIDFMRGTTFNWNVLSGTGAYKKLHGSGGGVGLDLCGPFCVLDVYDGGVHQD